MPDRNRHLARRSGPTAAVVAAICGAEILSLAGYSIVPALLPRLIADWSLTNTEGGWLAGISSAGYMLAVLPLVGLTDRLPARRIFLASSALNVLSCFGLALSDALLPALGFRALSGVALAGLYMPGLRALTGGLDGKRRSRVSALYTTSFTIGVSLSFLLGGAGMLWGWRGAFMLAAVLCAGGALVAWAALPSGDPETTGAPPALFDFRPVLANRDVLMLIFGYAAAIAGSAGLRQWIVVFLAFCGADRRLAATAGWSMLGAGALINLLGVPAGLLGNELSLRFGLRNTALAVFLLSALTGGVFGLAAMLPYSAVFWLSLAAGFVVQGNFANLTAGLLAVAAPRNQGATTALYSCLGLAAGFLGTLVFGVTLDRFGGAARLAAWTFSFATGGLVCLAGAAAMALLSRDSGKPIVPDNLSRGGRR
jgi:predicted MFS family arabinose efflux permease